MPVKPSSCTVYVWPVARADFAEFYDLEWLAPAVRKDPHPLFDSRSDQYVFALHYESVADADRAVSQLPRNGLCGQDLCAGWSDPRVPRAEAASTSAPASRAWSVRQSQPSPSCVGFGPGGPGSFAGESSPHIRVPPTSFARPLPGASPYEDWTRQLAEANAALLAAGKSPLGTPPPVYIQAAPQQGTPTAAGTPPAQHQFDGSATRRWHVENLCFELAGALIYAAATTLAAWAIQGGLRGMRKQPPTVVMVAPGGYRPTL
jgi:hypothetical protein